MSAPRAAGFELPVGELIGVSLLDLITDKLMFT